MRRLLSFSLKFEKRGDPTWSIRKNFTTVTQSLIEERKEASRIPDIPNKLIEIKRNFEEDQQASAILVEDAFKFELDHLLSYGLSFGSATIAIAVLYKLIILPINYFIFKESNKKQGTPDLSDYQVRIKKFYNSKNDRYADSEFEKFTAIKSRYKLPLSLGKFVNSTLEPIGWVIWYKLFAKISFQPEYTGYITHGGFLWFKDLSVSDPYFVLPLINCICQHYNIQNQNKNTTAASTSLYLVPIILFPIFSCFSSGLNLFFISLSFLQSMFLMHSRIYLKTTPKANPKISVSYYELKLNSKDPIIQENHNIHNQAHAESEVNKKCIDYKDDMDKCNKDNTFKLKELKKYK